MNALQHDRDASAADRSQVAFGQSSTPAAQPSRSYSSGAWLTCEILPMKWAKIS
jgi:hypothetical protein